MGSNLWHRREEWWAAPEAELAESTAILVMLECIHPARVHSSRHLEVVRPSHYGILVALVARMFDGIGIGILWKMMSLLWVPIVARVN